MIQLRGRKGNTLHQSVLKVIQCTGIQIKDPPNCIFNKDVMDFKAEILNLGSGIVGINYGSKLYADGKGF